MFVRLFICLFVFCSLACLFVCVFDSLFFFVCVTVCCLYCVCVCFRVAASLFVCVSGKHHWVSCSGCNMLEMFLQPNLWTAPANIFSLINSGSTRRLRPKICVFLNLIKQSSRGLSHTPPRWPSGKASASNAEDPGFESRLRRDFFGVESYQ